MLFHNSFLRLALWLLLYRGVQVQASSSFPNVDVVMRGGETIQAMDEADFPKYRNGKCTVRFPRDGNWATQNGFNTGGWDANGNSICPTLTRPGPKTMNYTLQANGNFVAYCGYYLDYATHTYDDESEDSHYFMAIDDDCILHIYKGVMDCHSVSIEKEIWTNVKFEPLQAGDVLRQGQYVRDKEAGTSLVLQSADGNLVLYQDGPSGPEGSVLWASNMEWGDGPGQIYEEYYVRIAHNGHLTLVGIDFDANGDTPREQVYFDKDLYSGGAACFTVEFVEIPSGGNGNLVAVPCAEERRRHLRGNQE